MLLFITLILMFILVGAEVDLFIPSFPELQSVFKLSPFMVELTLSVNLGSYCFTSLIVGNLGDRFGRRPVILTGLWIFVLGSIGCVLATAYWHLLLGRLLQGIGIAGPAVLSYLVLADRYSTEKQQQLLGILNGFITLAMALAPVVGSYINLLFHWRGNFVLLLIFGLLCLMLGGLFIPQAKPNPKIAISFKEYWPVFQSPKAFYYIATICLLILGYWLFIGIAPIFYMLDLNVTLEKFGFYQGAIAAIFAVGSFSSSYFLKKFGQKSCFFFSLGLLGVYMAASFVLMIRQVNNPLIITLVMQLLALAIILPVNILCPLSLEAVPEARGRIAALITAGRLTLTALGLQIVSYFYQGTFLSIGIAIVIVLLGAFVTCYKLFQEDKVFPEIPEEGLVAAKNC